MRRIAWILVPVVLVGLLALAVFATRGPAPSTAFTLRPGDCFDLPSDAQVGDVQTVDCTQAHDAEVFVVGALPSGSESPGSSAGAGAAASSASSGGASATTAAASSVPAASGDSSAGASDASASGAPPPYPGQAFISTWVAASCGATAQQTYLGRDASRPPNLVVGYFFPTADAWARGERQVTCYLHVAGSKLQAPLRGGAAGASPS